MASYKGHIKGGIITTVGTLLLAQPLQLSPLTFVNTFSIVIGVLLGSLLPDIDHPQSVLGRKLRFISTPLHKSFGHRTLTHSIFFLIATLVIPSLLGYEAFGIGLCIGTLSHIVLDLLCIGSGVAFFYPVYKHKLKLIPHLKPRKRRKR